MAKAAHWPDTDAEARKRGEQTGLDTLVVHAVNDECQPLVGLLTSGAANALSIPPGIHRLRRVFKSGVKSWSSTPELPLILKILSSGEVSGTASVEVKFVDIRKNTSGEGGSLARY